MVTYHDLAGKVVFITGGANGIGRAMVEAFVAQQATVYFCDVDRAAGESLQELIEGRATFREVDLTRESDIRRWTGEILAEAGKADVLVNNAARDPRIALADMKATEWDELFALNLRSFFIMTQELSPHMPEGASIVNLTSITHHRGPSEMSAYVATKSGIIGFTRSLARELGARRIRVNCIAPGWVMTERQIESYVTPEVKQMLKEEQSLPDLLQPEDIAEVALFLASDASRAMTGQKVVADHGFVFS